MNRLIISSMAASLLVLPQIASAGQTQEVTWGFELRAGPFQPTGGTQSIPDTNKNEHDYYVAYFGDGSPLLASIAFNRFLTDFFGPLGVSLEIGTWKASAKTHICRDSQDQVVACTTADILSGGSEHGNDTTVLHIFPLTIGAEYKLEVFKTRWGIPFVPYAKAGFDYFYWWISGGEQTARFSGAGGGSAKGGTLGFHGAIGLALSLNWIPTDPASQHHVFSDSYFFAEARATRVDGFGDAKRFDMSANHLTFGVAFDFE